MIDVTVTADDNGATQSVTVGGDSFNETPGLGARAQEPEFGAQFVGKTYPVALGEGIDAISGATITSTAVVDAVNQALLILQKP
ncbi:MAG: FMN-binding protein [Clostridiales bacterium]|nr:FMN-binding protein [Clostridiales bacterium]